MNEDTKKDSAAELEEPSTVSEAASAVHRYSHAQISRAIIQDSKIPIDARMLLVYLTSYREGWTFYDSKIREDLCIGFSKLKILFKQLRELGYVKTVPIIGEHGRMVGSKRLFSSLPEFKTKPREAANTTESMVFRQSEPPTVRKSEAKIPNSITKVDINKNKGKIYKKDFAKEFDQFWEKYPKKVDKHKSSMIYQKLMKQEGIGLHEVIMAAVCGQANEREITESLGMWQKPDKHPTTWLNGRCWENSFKTEEQLSEEAKRSKPNNNRQPSKTEERDRMFREFEDEAIADARKCLGSGGSRFYGASTIFGQDI